MNERCEILATLVASGQWRHQCFRCGRDHIAPAPNAVYACRGSKCRHLGPRVGIVKTVCETGCSQPSHVCDALGRCLPYFRPAGDALAQWLVRDEATIYHLCHGCQLRQPTDEGEPSLANHV